MKGFYRTLCQTIQNNEAVVLLTIIDFKGSAPRGRGAQMFVKVDGQTEGTIGGGAIEYRAVQTALTIFDKPENQIKKYVLNEKDADALGMICGGEATVLFQHLDPTTQAIQILAGKIQEDILENQNTWMITDFSDLTHITMISCSENECKSLDDEKQQLCCREAVYAEKEKIFVQPYIRREKVFIFGGGHVAKELVPVLAHLDFNCIVIDDREEFISEKRFPDAEERLLSDFNDLHTLITVKPQDYVIIMTRGHQNDYEVEAQMLKTPAHYIGIIGSRKKTAVINQKLRHEKGFTKEEIERVYTPIGKAIKAQTPAEIAISIAAELIEVRAES